MFYRIMRWIVYPFIRLFLRFDIHGTENIPKDQGYILCANHVSMADMFALAVPFHSQIRYMAKGELFRFRPLGWFFSALGTFAVQRGQGDTGAIDKACEIIEQGGVLGIFPEGTRHLPDLMSEVETGTAVLALRANVPLLPVYINGKLRLFHRTHVYVGQPMDISDLSAQGFDSQAVQQLTLRIRDTFLQMRADAGK